MIETYCAKFKINNILTVIKEKATNKEIVEDDTWLVAEGHYKSWWEYPCEPEHGQMNYIEQSIYSETISLNEEIYDGDFELVEVLEDIEDCDWSVEEGSLE